MISIPRIMPLFHILLYLQRYSLPKATEKKTYKLIHPGELNIDLLTILNSFEDGHFRIIFGLINVAPSSPLSGTDTQLYYLSIYIYVYICSAM